MNSRQLKIASKQDAICVFTKKNSENLEDEISVIEDLKNSEDPFKFSSLTHAGTSNNIDQMIVRENLQVYLHL